MFLFATILIFSTTIIRVIYCTFCRILIGYEACFVSEAGKSSALKEYGIIGDSSRPCVLVSAIGHVAHPI